MCMSELRAHHVGIAQVKVLWEKKDKLCIEGSGAAGQDAQLGLGESHESEVGKSGW